MKKLKISALPDDKPVKVSLELPAQIHRDLLAYAEVFSRETSLKVEPAKLIAPMLAQFMATDRAFSKARRKPAEGTVETARGSENQRRD